MPGDTAPFFLSRDGVDMAAGLGPVWGMGTDGYIGHSGCIMGWGGDKGAGDRMGEGTGTVDKNT